MQLHAVGELEADDYFCIPGLPNRIEIMNIIPEQDGTVTIVLTGATVNVPDLTRQVWSIKKEDL